jgi:hypothetical protein
VVGSGSTENFKRANAINVSFGMLAWNLSKSPYAEEDIDQRKQAR